jgi:hypothetical protein
VSFIEWIDGCHPMLEQVCTNVSIWYKSFAAMLVAGYVVGVRDHHLENILFDSKG